MKYCSIDVETTGLLDEPDARVWQIACTIEDTSKETPIVDLPTINFYVTYEDGGFYWSNGALEMNIKNFYRYLKTSEGVLDESSMATFATNTKFIGKYGRDQVREFVYAFLSYHFAGEKILFAGKNVGSFDIPFCKECGVLPQKMKAAVRYLDPSSGFIQSGDKLPPSLDECINRIPQEFKDAQEMGDLKNSHDALDDVQCVILAFRYLQSIGKVTF